ncbi:MAG: response regulator [Elusimicrobia bacterium]|nr:response regulator [Elusimicrobiota bacterium]
MRALIVEDDAMLSRLLRRQLSLWGWDADECPTISAAIESFAAGQYDLVLSDVDLPDGSGLALVQELARRKASLRVIVASGDPRNLERAKEAGFDRHLNKPFESDQLRILLEGPGKTGDPRSNVFKPGSALDDPAQFGGRLLLVEDEPVQLEEYRRALESEGFSIVPAGSAEAAIILTGQESFGAILTDNILPGMTGLQAIPLLRMSGAPVIVMSSQCGHDAEADALLLGAAAFINKPLAIREVCRVLRHIWRKR